MSALIERAQAMLAENEATPLICAAHASADGARAVVHVGDGPESWEMAPYPEHDLAEVAASLKRAIGRVAAWESRDLARFAVAVAEALPKLRREHAPYEADDGNYEECPAVNRVVADAASSPLDLVAVAAINAECPCRCGADEHNATLDRLAAMLEGE